MICSQSTFRIHNIVFVHWVSELCLFVAVVVVDVVVVLSEGRRVVVFAMILKESSGR